MKFVSKMDQYFKTMANQFQKIFIIEQGEVENSAHQHIATDMMIELFSDFVHCLCLH